MVNKIFEHFVHSKLHTFKETFTKKVGSAVQNDVRALFFLPIYILVLSCLVLVLFLSCLGKAIYRKVSI